MTANLSVLHFLFNWRIIRYCSCWLGDDCSERETVTIPDQLFPGGVNVHGGDQSQSEPMVSLELMATKLAAERGVSLVQDESLASMPNFISEPSYFAIMSDSFYDVKRDKDSRISDLTDEYSQVSTVFPQASLKDDRESVGDLDSLVDVHEVCVEVNTISAPLQSVHRSRQPKSVLRHASFYRTLEASKSSSDDDFSADE